MGVVWVGLWRVERGRTVSGSRCEPPTSPTRRASGAIRHQRCGAETLKHAYHARPAEQPRPGSKGIGPIMSARAQTFTLLGDTTGAPTFQRPVEDLSALSMIRTAAHCALYSFNAAVSGL